MSPAGVPHPPSIQEEPAATDPVDPRAMIFRKLPDEMNEWFWQVAEKKAVAGICFMCKWIIDGEDHPWFERESQEIHMMLCCVPDRHRNLKLLEMSPQEAEATFAPLIDGMLKNLEEYLGEKKRQETKSGRAAAVEKNA